MAGQTLRTIASPEELRAAAPEWDRLWQASDCQLPTLQAELLAVELAHFRPAGRMRFLAVERDGQFDAALPLIDRSGFPGWRLGSLTGNYWSPSSDLLVDPNCDVDGAMDTLVDGLRAAGWPLVDFHAVDIAAPRWQAWRRAIERRRLASLERERLVIAVTRTNACWSQYLSTISRNHRRRMRRAQRKCDALGGVRLRVERPDADADVAPLLRRGFEIEHASWKGREVSSVLASAGIFDFYTAQAACLAARGQLQLSYLELDGKPIAFEYGWLSKGVYFVLKVGYDPAHAELTPGQMLRWQLFEKLHHEGRCRAIDFLGPPTRAISSWANDQYTISRLVVAPKRLSGRLALTAYRAAQPLLRWATPGSAPGAEAGETPDGSSAAELSLARA